MADLRDIEDLCREHGWRNVGPSADLADWLRDRFREHRVDREKVERLQEQVGALRDKLARAGLG